MNQLVYDLVLTITLMLMGMFGLGLFVQEDHSIYLGMTSAAVLMLTVVYTFTMPRYLSLPDRNENKHLVRFICEVSQKFALFFLLLECFIIIASN